MTNLTTDLSGLLGHRVEIYVNLHQPHGTFSVRSAEGASRGLVVAHAQVVRLKDAEFKVATLGRDRVRKQQRKEVHAYVRGTLSHIEPDVPGPMPNSGRPVRYNPYETDFFIDRETGERVDAAQEVTAVAGWLTAIGAKRTSHD